MRIHVIGVSGTGMGSLAGLLVSRGHTVSGSDLAFAPPMGPLLATWGIQTQTGYAAEHVTPDLDLVIVGNVCRSNNPEAERARALGLEITHIAGALQRFALPETQPVVVAGTHGKTTTSSLLAWVLDCAGLEPGFFIGGVPLNFGGGFRAAGSGGARNTAAPFVLEGDEYDTAFFEKTAKFLHYGARHAILTSIEHDHIDIYPDAASYRAAFAAFVRLLPSEGVLVANRDDAQVRALVEAYVSEAGARCCRVIWYSAQGDDAAEFRVQAVETSGQAQHFDVVARGRALGRVTLPLSGRHNVGNALAVVACALEAFDCPMSATLDALASFRGVKRRQEVVGVVDGVTVYDDFAHHPTAVQVTLEGLRARHPQGRLAAVFEARSATACRKLHQAAYARAFDAADLTLFAPIGRPEIPQAERLDLAQLAAELSAAGHPATACENTDAILDRLGAWARPGDAVVLLSNGSLGALARPLLARLGTQRNTP